MGQYFKAVIGKKDVRKLADCRIFHPFRVCNFDGVDIGGGQKLTEHGWLGNFFCEAVEHEIYTKPMRVAWIGDYADVDMRRKARTNAEAAFIPGKNVWKPSKPFDGVERLVIEGDEGAPLFMHSKFLVNHTKKLFIDMDAYIERAKGKSMWWIDPLPVLTAIGNGEGGGDYYGDRDADKVGTWAWCEISVEDAAPADYTEFSPTFFDAGDEPDFKKDATAVA